MYTPEDITNCFDVKALQYLQNKNRGGTSGQKGTRYEDLFAVYQLATLGMAVLEGQQEIYLFSQVLAFVDDLIIDCNTTALRHYQLKNSLSVSWTSNDHQITRDFEQQHALNQQAKNRDCQLYLVVADSALQATLQARTPQSIQAFSQVLHFSFSPDLLKTIGQTSGFYEAIAYLSAFDQPDPDKIEYVAKTLMGAWITSNQSRISVIDLLTQAQQVSPCYIRSFSQNYQLDSEVIKIFDAIPDFTYNLAKGFLHWEYLKGLEQGTPPYSINSADFCRLQKRIKRQKPKTFDELESLL